MKTCGGAAFSRHRALEPLFRYARASWVMAPTADHLGWFKDALGRLGQRTAEMHQALATPEGDRAFATETMTPEFLRALAARMHTRIAEALELLRTLASALPSDAATVVGHTLERESQLLAEADAAAALVPHGLARARIHGGRMRVEREKGGAAQSRFLAKPFQWRS